MWRLSLIITTLSMGAATSANDISSGESKQGDVESTSAELEKTFLKGANNQKKLIQKKRVEKHYEKETSTEENQVVNLVAENQAQSATFVSSDLSESSWLSGGEWHLAIAAGVGHRSNPLVNSDELPIHWVVDLAYYSDRFFFDNGELGLYWHVGLAHQFELFLTYTNEREYYRFFDGAGRLGFQHGSHESVNPDPDSDHTSVSHHPHHVELPARDLAIEAGIGWSYTKDWGQLTFQWLQDVSNTFNGDEAWFSYQYQLYYYGLSVAFTGALAWNSAELANYYYGVPGHEASQALPEYQVGEALNQQVKVSLMYDLNEHWQWVGLAQLHRLDYRIAASPIIDADKIVTWFTGFRFVF